MNEPKFDRQKLDAYLLGALPAAEAERFDELSFTDDEFVDALRFAENDLVDAYAGGELSGAELEKFETHYSASPLRNEKIRFAKNFRIYAEKNNAPEFAETFAADSETKRDKTGFFAGVLASLRVWQVGMAALALIVISGWLLVENSRLRNRSDESLARQTELEQRETELRDETATQKSSANAEKESELARIREDAARIEKERAQRELVEREERYKEMLAKQKLTETPPPTAAPRPPIVALFTLTPQLRGGNLPTIFLPANADTVKMRLELEPHDFSSYRVALKTQTSDRILWRSGNLKARAAGEDKILNVSFPARLLRAQTYALEVSGIGADGKPEIIGDYFFRNVR